MAKYYLGCDLGLKGGLSLLEDNKVIACEPMPVIEAMVGKKMRNQYDIKKIDEIIETWLIRTDYKLTAIMERLRAIPNQASQTGFSMGYGVGVFKTLMAVNKIPFIEIEPRDWQKKVFGDLGIQYDKKTTKQASIVAAKQLFPSVDFRPTERCKVYSDGMTDSALIGYYGINLTICQ